MSVVLNKSAFERAKERVAEGRFILDERDAWSEHRPTASQENSFIRRYGFHEYRTWHLGVDTEEPENTKGRYKFPYGDFSDIHQCAVLSAESRAGQYKYRDIELAAAHLHGMLMEEMVRK